MDVVIAGAAELNAARRNKRRYEVYTFPESEGGLTVRYQSLTALEKGRLQTAAFTKDGTTDLTRLADSEARLLAATLVDADGNRLFSDREANQICTWDYTPGLAELVRRIRKHCGISVDEEEKRTDFTGGDSGGTLLDGRRSENAPAAGGST